MRKARTNLFSFLCLMLVSVPAATGVFAIEQSTGNAQEIRITVLSSHDAHPFEEALDGFREHLPLQGIDARLEVCQLEGDSVKAERTIGAVDENKSSLILALGSLAAEAVNRKISGTPIVAGLIMDDQEIKTKENATGVLLDIPVDIQFQWIVRLLPECRKIGVLYNPARNNRRIQAAMAVASRLGLELHVQKVEKPSDLPGALEYLANRIHALWGIPDDLVYTPRTARHILLFSMQNRIPLIGLSETWVKAGALFSIDADYRDVGVQCAEAAAQLLRGRKPSSIPPVHPRKLTYSLNLKTAGHMKLGIPEAIVRDAHEVFR